MIRNFWNKKKVLVTGHTGFKGSWLCLWLSALGAEVTGYALEPPTDPNLFGLCNIDELINSIRGDVRDFSFFHKVLSDIEPEFVIHMAAQPLVRDSYLNPVETYEINVMGTVNVMEAVRVSKGVRALVNVTTDKCYDNQEWLWGYRENEPLGGYDPYSNSKACSELVTDAYRNSFFNPKDYKNHKLAVASVRAGNVIGGGDWADDRLIPDIMRAITQGKSVNIRNPHAIRPWQHVLEPLHGYLLLAQKLYEEGAAYAEGWNFGPNDEDAKSVQWIAEKLTKSWGEGASWVLDAGDHPHEAHYLKLDCAKAKVRLGWQPRWHLEDALSAIIDWHRAYLEGKDMRALTLRQISAYSDGFQKH